MTQRVILHHKEMGIYLGSALGFGFWSKLDPAGQDAAWTFESIEHARLAIEGWDSPIENPMFTHVEVDGEFASIAQCVAAGLDAWEPNAIPDLKDDIADSLPLSGYPATRAMGRKLPCGCTEIQVSDTEWQPMHVDGCWEAEMAQVKSAMRRKHNAKHN